MSKELDEWGVRTIVANLEVSLFKLHLVSQEGSLSEEEDPADLEVQDAHEFFGAVTDYWQARREFLNG